MNTAKIMSAKYLREYKIKISFTNGKIIVVDFYSFLSAPNQNPMSSKYLDINKFKKFEILYGRDISWNNREMCFPFKSLYKGEIESPNRDRLKRMAVKYFGRKKAEKIFS